MRSDLFSAQMEAWDLVCNCLEDLFTKEFKLSLCFYMALDLVDVCELMEGIVYSVQFEY